MSIVEVIYRTRHVKMLHIYDCGAGFSNWILGANCPGVWQRLLLIWKSPEGFIAIPALSAFT
jgi:hypothetical protein